MSFDDLTEIERSESRSSFYLILSLVLKYFSHLKINLATMFLSIAEMALCLEMKEDKDAYDDKNVYVLNLFILS